MTLNRRGFTLVELLVVVAMIAVIMGAISTSFSAARTRAGIQKATSEVKVISQAILAYETWNKGELDEMEDAEANKKNLEFLLGDGSAKGAIGADAPGKLPALLMARLQGDKAMVDPWGTPYRMTIRRQAIRINYNIKLDSLKTGYYIPNLYRTTEAEK